jgi:hypothetical protein
MRALVPLFLLLLLTCQEREQDWEAAPAPQRPVPAPRLLPPGAERKPAPGDFKVPPGAWVPSGVALDTPAARARLRALLLVLDEEARDPRIALTIRSEVFGALRARAEDISQALGYDILDDQGRIVDPARVLQDLKEYLMTRFPPGEQMPAFKRLFGNEAGAAIYHADLNQVDHMVPPQPR